MQKKVLIVERQGSFSDEWIRYCQEAQILYELVDPYSNEIVSKVAASRAFLWHWRHDSYKDQLFARQLFSALAITGVPLYPDITTCWHFDDKVGQKYLFEAASIPSATASVFYDMQSANDWLQGSSFPVVFKLRGGAGAINVRLVETLPEARRLVRKAFTKGFAYFERWEIFKQSIWRAKRDKSVRSVAAVFYHLARSLIPFVLEKSDLHPRELGYVYFQDFIPQNTFDDRLVVVEGCCFAVRRFCRTGDFRASGSGLKDYDPALFPKASIELAFKLADTLKMQSVAIDLVYKEGQEPVVVEVSFGCVTAVYPGYFDRSGVWHEGAASVPVKILDALLARVQ